MNFSDRLTSIDFTDFMGQKVTDITAIGLELLNVKLVDGSLNVECSWRLRGKTDILVGINERKETDFISILKEHLMNTPISNISHFVTGDLLIEFGGQYYLDLFADSSVFEQYQLYRGERLFLIGR